MARVFERRGKLKALPPEKWTIGFKYSPRLPLPGQLSFNGAWLHHSKFWNNLANELDLVQAHERDLYNASISWVDDEGRWKAAIEGRNLANTHYIVNAVQLAHPISPSITGYPNPPRTVQFRLGVQF